MKPRLCTLLFPLLAACASARTSAAAPATRTCDAPPPAEQPPQIDGLMSARIAVPYSDVGAIANALRDIFQVRPDRGDVRAILHDHRDPTLFVIATREGIAKIQKLLATLPAPASAK